MNDPFAHYNNLERLMKWAIEENDDNAIARYLKELHGVMKITDEEIRDFRIRHHLVIPTIY